MHREDADVCRLWLFLAMFGLALACSPRTPPPVAASPVRVVSSPAPVSSPSSGDESWLNWGDKVGSIVGAVFGVVGAIAGVGGLALTVIEVRRIRRELARRPDLRAGFYSTRDASGRAVVSNHSARVVAQYSPDDELSEPIPLDVHTANYGDRSAQAILWNATLFCPEVDIVESDREEPGRRRIHREAGRLVRLVVNLDYVHSQDAYIMRIPLRVRRHHQRLELHIVGSCLDGPTLKQKLELFVDQR